MNVDVVWPPQHKGSDEATEVLIGGVIKALAKEVGLPLSSRSLSLHHCQDEEKAFRGCSPLRGERNKKIAPNGLN